MLNKENDIIDAILSLPLHDQSLELLNFDFSKKEAVLKIEMNNEEKGHFEYLEIRFFEIDEIEISPFNLSLDKDFTPEIYSFTIIRGVPKSQLNCTVLLGFGKPSTNFSFKFSKVLLVCL